jgi:hypothetical protein
MINSESNKKKFESMSQEELMETILQLQGTLQGFYLLHCSSTSINLYIFAHLRLGGKSGQSKIIYSSC